MTGAFVPVRRVALGMVDVPRGVAAPMAVRHRLTGWLLERFVGQHHDGIGERDIMVAQKIDGDDGIGARVVEAQGDHRDAVENARAKFDVAVRPEVDVGHVGPFKSAQGIAQICAARKGAA